MKLPEQERMLARVISAIEAIRDGKMIIMVDQEDRENEGDIVFAAQHVDPDKINFMAKHARGLICLALDPAIVDRLELPMMRDAGKSGCARETAFTMSIEAKHGVTTGISARDRAETIRVAVAADASADDLVVPGHIFPLRARAGGVLERAGHTEGAVDLARLAGCSGAAAICEIMNEDGSMARMADLEKLAQKFELPIISIPELIQYRLLQESLVVEELRTRASTPFGIYDAYVFTSKIDGSCHFAFVKGVLDSTKVVDVRVHMQRPIVDCFSGDDEHIGKRLAFGLDFLREAETGVFLYLTKNHSPQSLLAEFTELVVSDGQANAEVNSGSGNVMDQRHIGLGAQILRKLGVKRMRILAASHKSFIGLSGFDLEVTEHVQL